MMFGVGYAGWIYVYIDIDWLDAASVTETKIANRQLQPTAMERQLTSFNVAHRSQMGQVNLKKVWTKLNN